MSLEHLVNPIYTTTGFLLGASKGRCRCCAVVHILQELADGVLAAAPAVTLAMFTEVWTEPEKKYRTYSMYRTYRKYRTYRMYRTPDSTGIEYL